MFSVVYTLFLHHALFLIKLLVILWHLLIAIVIIMLSCVLVVRTKLTAPSIKQVNYCVPCVYVMQLRQEFKSIAGYDDSSKSLLCNWSEWVEKIVGLGKVESSTRPSMYSFIREYNAIKAEEVHSFSG